MLANPVYRVALALAVLTALGAVGAALVYRGNYLETKGQLATLSAAVTEQKQAAALRLAELTTERDQLQGRIDRHAADREKQDAVAKAEIDRLAAELERRLIRVRYVAADSGGSGGGSAGDATASTGDRSAGAASSAGVLPAENSRRLGLALIEVEKLSAAYTSCRAALFGP